MKSYNKKRGFLKLSFVEIRTFVPTDYAVERGDRRCICEINLNEALSKIGIGLNDKIIKIIDRHIPVSTISYFKNGHLETERFINERFTVTAVATCSENDEWYSEKGMMISRSKAKKKAFKKAFKLYEGICMYLVTSTNDVMKSMKLMCISDKNEDKWIQEITEK